MPKQKAIVMVMLYLSFDTAHRKTAFLTKATRRYLLSDKIQHVLHEEFEVSSLFYSVDIGIPVQFKSTLIKWRLKNSSKKFNLTMPMAVADNLINNADCSNDEVWHYVSIRIVGVFISCVSQDDSSNSRSYIAFSFTNQYTVNVIKCRIL